MAMQSINVGATDNDGTGDKPRPAAMKINANFAELYGRANSKPAILNCAGDSKAGEAVEAFSRMAARYPLALKIGVSIAVGGSGTGNLTNGLTSTTKIGAMTSMITADIAAGYVSDIVVTSATNDYSGASGETISPTQVISNIQKHYLIFKSCGGRYYILMGFDPRSGAGSTWGSSFDKLASQLAQLYPDIIFVPTAPWLQDWSHASGEPIGGTSQSLGAAMDGAGLHCKNWGNSLKSFAMEGSRVRELYSAKSIRFPAAGEMYSATRQNANIVGGNGRSKSTGGSNSSTNGTVVGTPPLGWNLSGNLQGLNINFNSANNTQLKSRYGAASQEVPVVRMTVSGSPTAIGSFTLNIPSAVSMPANSSMRLVAQIYCNPTGSDPIMGMAGLSLNDGWYTNQAGGFVHHLGNYAPTVAADVLIQIPDGLYNFESTGFNANGYGPVGVYGPNLNFRFFSGVPFNGTFDLIGMGQYVENAMVLPAA